MRCEHTTIWIWPAPQELLCHSPSQHHQRCMKHRDTRTQKQTQTRTPAETTHEHMHKHTRIRAATLQITDTQTKTLAQTHAQTQNAHTIPAPLTSAPYARQCTNPDSISSQNVATQCTKSVSSRDNSPHTTSVSGLLSAPRTTVRYQWSL